MAKVLNQARLAIAILQCATFTVGLSFGQHLLSVQPGSPARAEEASGGALHAPVSARRPPRWPGRSKNAKGLAIREASAVKPLSRSRAVPA